jgi:Sulfotransferase family
VSSPPVTVLYVGGFSRSGTTLLGRVLGEAPEAICVGETRYLWTRGLQDNVQCGCGAPFEECRFWSAVGQEAFGGWRALDLERVGRLDAQTNRVRALPFHWVPRARPGFAGALAEYAELLRRLYDAIGAVSGAKTIVETSKDPNFGSLLARMPGRDVRIVHLVRDPRAVAYSWMRHREMPSPIGAKRFMPKFRPTEVATKWLAWNAAFHALALRGVAKRTITYESFIADPAGTLARLSEFAGQPLELPESRLAGGEVKLGEHHIFSGNPMRASQGWLRMRLDDEWQSGLATPHLVEVNAISLPLLRPYGYPLIPAGRHAQAPPP